MDIFKRADNFCWTTLILGLSLPLLLIHNAKASSPESAPNDLRNDIANIDNAANNHRIDELLKFYSPNFTTADGLDEKQLKKTLVDLWKHYPDLHYNTRLLSWEQGKDGIVTQTVTSIQGTSQQKGTTFKISSDIKSSQVFRGNQLVNQEILSESTQIKSGTKPPEVEISLPKSVKAGEGFDFDVIIKEPLNNQVAVGYAIDDKVDPARYLKPSAFDLEVLQAGGIFKRVKAPDTPQDRWLSAVVIQSDGMTIVTQRLKIEK